MAKTPATGKAPAKAKASTVNLSIESLSVKVLEKLKSLELDPQLQADLEWCIGSFRFDGQPAGLYHHVSRAAEVFKEELSKKTKGVTAKFVNEVNKELATLAG